MTRGVRRTPLEKLKGELSSTMEVIEQYATCLATLKEKAQDIKEQIELEELKPIVELLKEEDMRIDDLKELIQTYNVKQSAQTPCFIFVLIFKLVRE